MNRFNAQDSTDSSLIEGAQYKDATRRRAVEVIIGASTSEPHRYASNLASVTRDILDPDVECHLPSFNQQLIVFCHIFID